MLRKLFLGLVLTIYALGLAISGPLNVGAKTPPNPVSGPVSKPVPGPISLYITGHIRVLTSPVSGIKVLLFSTTKKSTTLKAIAYTDSQGAYRFNAPQGNYLVLPQDSRYIFAPIQQLISLVKNSIEYLDFSAIQI